MPGQTGPQWRDPHPIALFHCPLSGVVVKMPEPGNFYDDGPTSTTNPGATLSHIGVDSIVSTVIGVVYEVGHPVK